MNLSNSDIAKILINDDHLSDNDKSVLLKILGYDNDSNSDEKSTGDMISQKITGFIGSWKFIIGSIIIMIIWMVINSLLKKYFGKSIDSFPFEFLNVVLACTAAIQAPIIMISQNKQDTREALKTQSDYEIDLKTIILIEELYKNTVEINSKLDTFTEFLNQNNIKDTNNIIDFKGIKKKDN